MADTTQAPPVASTSTLPPPTQPSGDFTADPRVHFNQQSGKWAFEDDDGTEMEWEEQRGVWVPVVSDLVIPLQIYELTRAV